MRKIIIFIMLAPVSVQPAAAYDWDYLGMSGVSTTCIEADWEHGRILVGTAEGFWIYDVDTEVWTERDDEGWIGRTVHAIQSDPVDPQRIITGRENAFFKGYLEVSTDGGVTGQVVHMSQGGAFVGLSYGMAGHFACGISDITPGELLYSDDSGATWTPLTGHGHTAMTDVAATEFQTLSVAGDDQVWVTYDLGATWVDASPGLGNGLVQCLTSFFSGGDIINEPLLAGDAEGLWVNENPFNQDWYHALADDSVVNATVMWSVAPWPIGRDNHYVAITADGRVLVSEQLWPGGWVDETGTLPSPAVDIAFLYETGDLYVCTADGGVYNFDPDIASSVEVPVAAGPALEVWPNPFNPRATLHWSLPRGSTGRLAVYDVAGRLVTVVEEGFFAAGDHTRTWNATSQASGVYVARLETDQGTVAVRLSLVR